MTGTRLVSLALAAALLGGCAGKIGDLEAIRRVEIGHNREFRVNGKPMIPLQVWLQDPVHFPKLKAAGINTCAGYWWDDEKQLGQGETRSIGEYAAMVREAGFYFIPPYMPGQMDDMRRLARSDFVLAWDHNDEPDLPKKVTGPDGKQHSVPQDSLEETAEKYRRFKELDTTRPVIMGFTANFMKSETQHYDEAAKARIYPEYVKYCDGAAFDTYPIYGWNRPDWLYKVAEGVSELRAIAGPERFVGAAIETCKGSRWISLDKQLDVTPADTRAEVWMALIRGATMITYFTHSWRPEPYTQFACTDEMVAELGRLNRQVQRLAPALLADPASVAISMSLETADGDELDCHFKATELGGWVYIFAQNMDMKRRGGKASFMVIGLKEATTVEVLDEERTLTAGSSRFADDFAPLAEHIYRFRK